MIRICTEIDKGDPIITLPKEICEFQPEIRALRFIDPDMDKPAVFVEHHAAELLGANHQSFLDLADELRQGLRYRFKRRELDHTHRPGNYSIARDYFIVPLSASSLEWCRVVFRIDRVEYCEGDTRTLKHYISLRNCESQAIEKHHYKACDIEFSNNPETELDQRLELFF